MSYAERFETAVLSKHKSSMEFLSEELSEMGIDFFADEQFAAYVKNKIKGDFASFIEEADEEQDEDVLVSLGENDELSPRAFSRIVTLAAVSSVLKKTEEIVKDLKENEEKKFKQWADKHVRDGFKLDVTQLALVKTDGEDLDLLETSKEIVFDDEEVVRKAVAQIPEDTDQWQLAFYRDLGQARLSDPRIEKLLQDLWGVTEPEVIDAVLSDDAIKNDRFFKPIDFLGQMLKGKIAKGIVLEDEEEAA